MKYVLVASLALASLSAFANKHDKMKEDMMKKMDSMSFEDAKKWKMDMLSQKKSMLTEEESCVGSAKDKAALKKCSEDMHAKMESMMKDQKKKM